MDDPQDPFLSDSPPSAGDDGSDYEAPLRLKYASQKRSRQAKPRVTLRPRKRRASQSSYLPDDDDSDDVGGDVLPDISEDDFDLDDARAV